MSALPVVYVLVCGNADRRDDGAAIRAVRALIATNAGQPRKIHFERCGQLDVDHLLEIPRGRPVVIVDAAAGVEPGEVVAIPLDDLIDDPHGPAPHSSHALPINQVLGIANVLAAEPLSGVFVGVGGADYEFGDELSDPVERAMPWFIAAIAGTIDELASVAPANPDRHVH